jgi:hypothetical protein
MTQINPWLWRASGFLAVLAVVGYLALQEHKTGQRVARAEAFDPCVTLAQAVEHSDPRDRVRTLTAECRTFLNGLGPLVSLRLACAILREGGYECPKPGSEAAQREVVAGSGNTPHGQPSPAPTGEKGAPGTSRPSHPEKKPPTQAVPAPGSSPAPPPAEPGNSGKGASAEHGLDVCVEIAVSACVKTDAELP